MSIVLMYHALYADNDISLIDSDDLPYAVSVSDFTQQMELLQRYTVGIWSDIKLPDIIITFDDGHISNHDLALPILKQFGFHAYFFITSGFIGERRGFCEPVHISNMADLGHVVGAHGQTHLFFDDLTPNAAEAELRACSAALKDITGDEVHSISFPGGRFNDDTVKLCDQTGLKLMFGSEFGAVKGAAVKSTLKAPDVINRIAIRRNTSLTEFKRIISRDKKYYITQTAKHQCKLVVQRMLGNKLYHGLYRLLSKR